MLNKTPFFYRGYSKHVGMDGASAVADVAYRMSEMSFLFPITPATPSSEAVEKWASEGRKNVFGKVVDITQMQSEGGVAGAFHGAAGSGALSTTFTASQGLMLMIPEIYRVAGDHLPGVFHVAARSLGTMGPSIYGDHSDIMCAKASGAAMLCSSNPQECADFAAISHATSIKSSYPFIHFYDGFRTSHEINTLKTIPDEVLMDMIDHDALTEYKLTSMNPDRPTQRGGIFPIEIFWQFWERGNLDLQKIEPNVIAMMNKLGKLTGRHYEPYEYFGDPEATDIIVSMGSASKIFEELIKSRGKGSKLGVINIHLFRPFITEKFLSKLPRSAKRLCVLDRSRDIIASKEPLHMEVHSIIRQARPDISIIGGKYGLSSKEFNPTHAEAVISNLKLPNPKDRFNVGIIDDLTFTSIPIGETKEILPNGTKQCIFWGFGSDGTVGACKDAIKIIVNNTDLYGQGYFAYTAHKSGGITTSHLRFGPEPIEAPYLIQEADYIACHKPYFVKKFDILKQLKNHGTVVLNAPSNQSIEDYVPGEMKRAIASKKAKLYYIDASSLSTEMGLRGRTNTVMQTAFFILSGVLPQEMAIKLLKDAAFKAYSKKGEEVINKNLQLIENTNSNLKEYTYDQTNWENAPDSPKKELKLPPVFNEIMTKMMVQKGDEVKVSETTKRGEIPAGGTQYEKRGIAEFVPVWDSNKCVQCGLCSTVCPHAVIRPFLLTKEELSRAPEGFESAKQKIGKSVDGFEYTIQVSAYDCTGCGKCSNICPAKALTMTPSEPLFESKHKKWEFINTIENRANLVKPNAIKNTQFLQPLLEFSGACAGCGETAIIKMITQLYGHKSFMAFATGCPVVWGASAPSNAFTKNKKGKGPAWTSSLFEDHAEFGFGQYKAMEMRRRAIREIIQGIQTRISGENSELIQKLLANWNNDQSEILSEKFLSLVEAGAVGVTDEERRSLVRDKSFIAHKMNWIIGGDGWAYDIGYGGLDHILASGEPVKVVVLDTEVYSNTGGQPSKASNRSSSNSFSSRGVGRAKKDLALIAQTYGHIYVANTCLDADPRHALKALQEAVDYKGPSLIINYCPCIEHGFTQGLGNSPAHTKELVDGGYLILSRFDPRLAQEGKNPLQIDSPKPTFDVDKILDQEVRYSNLAMRSPERAKELRDKLNLDFRSRIAKYERLKNSYN